MYKNTPLLFAVLLLGACGTAQTYHNVTTEQRNPEWQQVPISKLAVVAISEDRGERIGTETVFADRLTADGIDTIASYDFVPNLALLDSPTEASSMMAEKSVDAELTLSLAKPAAGYDRDAYWEARGWAYILGSDNTRAWGDLADIANYGKQGKYSLDIGLWDGKTVQPIWHAQTDSNEWDEGSAGVQRLADAIADMLVERGFVSKP